jgi:hypothetical protein
MKFLPLFLLVLVISFPVHVFAAPANYSSNQNRYLLPANISIKIVHTNNGKLTAIITPLTGSLKNVNIRFITSEGVAVHTKPINLKSLTEEYNFSIGFERKDNKNDQWIKMLVEYLPDFDDLMKKVTDNKTYPDPQLRLRLIKKVNSFSRLHKKFTEATFYRFPEVNNK